MIKQNVHSQSLAEEIISAVVRVTDEDAALVEKLHEVKALEKIISVCFGFCRGGHFVYMWPPFNIK